MDGNGRWAKRRHLPRVSGHRAGVEAVRATVETCAQLGLRALNAVRVLGRELEASAGRSGDAVASSAHISRVGAAADDEARHSVWSDRKIRRASGVRARGAGRVVRRTGNNRGLRLNLAIQLRRPRGNRGRSEGAGGGARAGRAEIDEAAISARLYTAGTPDPDLLIRTSGEMRVSNFLLWQIATRSVRHQYAVARF